MKQALLDADSIIYKIASACDNRHYNYKGKRYETKAAAIKVCMRNEGDPSAIVLGISPESEDDTRNTLLSFTEEKLKLVPEGFTQQLYIGSPGNFRYGIAERATYKGNRDRSQVPTHLNFTRDVLQEYYDVVVARPELEADDEVAIAASDPTKESVILSIDKDLLQIPGTHINFDTEKETIVDGFQGIKSVAQQMLLGDTSDNIPGINGVGPKSKYLSNIQDAATIEEVFSIVVDRYQSYFGYYAFQFMREAFILLRMVKEPTVYEVYFMTMLNIEEDYWK